MTDRRSFFFFACCSTKHLNYINLLKLLSPKKMKRKIIIAIVVYMTAPTLPFNDALTQLL